MTQSSATEEGLTVMFLIEDVMLHSITMNVAFMICCKVPAKVAAVYVLETTAKSRTRKDVCCFLEQS